MYIQPKENTDYLVKQVLIHILALNRYYYFRYVFYRLPNVILWLIIGGDDTSVADDVDRGTGIDGDERRTKTAVFYPVLNY